MISFFRVLNWLLVPFYAILCLLFWSIAYKVGPDVPAEKTVWFLAGTMVFLASVFQLRYEYGLSKGEVSKISIRDNVIIQSAVNTVAPGLFLFYPEAWGVCWGSSPLDRWLFWATLAINLFALVKWLFFVKVGQTNSEQKYQRG